MSYQLEYGMQAINIKKGIKRNKYLDYLLKLALLILCVVTIHLLTMLFYFMMLGPSATTKIAADQMVENLRSGQPFHEVIQIFCQTTCE